MNSAAGAYSAPRWRATRWLTGLGHEVPPPIRAALIASLYGTLPIFVGGVLNTTLVAVICAIRQPTPAFLAWVVIEVAVCLVRIVVLVKAQRAAIAGRSTPTDLYMLLALAWSASVGYGTFVSLISGDWVVATIACLSAAGMAGGICFRNFGSPRLAGAMMLLSLGPCCPATLLTGEPLLLTMLLQIPFYLLSMFQASYRLNALLVSTMIAERDNDHRAHHDELTGLANRAGLERALVARRAASAAHAGRLALLYLDLDGFKTVNDTFGHAAGDGLLQTVGERLGEAIGATGVAARIGGDEFVVLSEIVDEAGALALGDRLIRDIAGRGYVLGKHVGKVGVSIGVALSPEHGEELGSLLAAADRALYSAKASGRFRSRLARVPGERVTAPNGCEVTISLSPSGTVALAA